MTRSSPPSDGFESRPTKPAPRKKLGDEVAQYLREALMAGRYLADQRLGVEDLAEELGVSTMPVREALLTLANEGLLVVRPRRGFRVVQLTVQDIEDVYDVHAYLSGRLAERAAANISEQTVGKLADLQRRIERATADKEPLAVLERLNSEFHREINRCAKSPRLEWFLRAATRYLPRQFYEDVPEWAQTSTQDHPAIIEALVRHDGDGARQLMEQHVERAGALVVRSLLARGWPRGAQAPADQSLPADQGHPDQSSADQSYPDRGRPAG
jgi:DNA-binding GntR family transcriptional regulator